MSSTMHQFYIAPVADARRDADAATLANVRDRCLKYAMTRHDLGTRAADAETMRTRLATGKAAARADLATLLG